MISIKKADLEDEEHEMIIRIGSLLEKDEEVSLNELYQLLNELEIHPVKEMRPYFISTLINLIKDKIRIKK